MIFEMNITVMVSAETPEEAIEKLIGEFDYLFELDNDLIAYTHPQTVIEGETA